MGGSTTTCDCPETARTLATISALDMLNRYELDVEWCHDCHMYFDGANGEIRGEWEDAAWYCRNCIADQKRELKSIREDAAAERAAREAQKK